MWHNTIYDRLKVFDSNKKFIKSRWWHFGIQVPSGLPIKHYKDGDETWVEWEIRMTKEYPIRYRMYKTLNDFHYWLFDSQYSWHYLFKWWLLHRLHPNHRYHVLKPRTLKPRYIDPSEMMLHCCFELLTSYLEHGATSVDWQYNETFSNVYKEMVELQSWWENEYCSIDDWSREIEHDEIDDKLKRLINIRQYMW